MLTIAEATPGRQVAYVPQHARKRDGSPDWKHPDICMGFVAGTIRGIDSGNPFVHCRYYNAPPHDDTLRTIANGEATNLSDLWLHEHHAQAKILADWRACDGGQLPEDFGL